jgi:transmembrane sensor
VILRFRTASQDSSTEQAASWYARQRSGPLSPADEAQFTAWLRGDPANVTAWKEFEDIWSGVESVRNDPTILAIREAALRRVQRHPVAPKPRTWSIAVALAACVVLGVAIWAGFKGPLPVSADRPGPSLTRYASTAVGERSVLVLSDGSKVTLNTASALGVDYSGHERRVSLLAGEAFFDVVKDPTRPFIVSARSREVTAVGTSFDVRLQQQQLRVTLIEGKVRVTPAARTGNDVPADTALPVTLRAGTALVVAEDGVGRIEEVDTRRATSWLDGKLIFDEERLADVVVEMNRYSGTKLEIGNPALEERRVSGVFEVADGLTVAKALQDYGIARIIHQSATAIVLDLPSRQPDSRKSVSP